MKQHVLECKGVMVFIACPVCSQGYEDNAGHRPLIIPCGHTFCEACIKNMSQVSVIFIIHVRCSSYSLACKGGKINPSFR